MESPVFKPDDVSGWGCWVYAPGSGADRLSPAGAHVFTSMTDPRGLLGLAW